MPPAASARTRGRAATAVPRRGVLAAGVAAATALLGGCGLRLDLPQPPPPTPTRELVPDEALLVGFVRDLRDLVALGRRLPETQRSRPEVRDCLRILTTQDTVLTGRLTNDGVPTDVITASPTPTSTSSPGTGTTPSVARLRSALVDVPKDRWTSVAGSTPANRPVLLSATSARLATAVRLGERVAVPQGAPQAVRAALVEHTTPLVYGFEVVAAQSAGPARQAALDTLALLRTLLTELGEVQGSALPGGWPLPYPVTTPAAAKRLAHDLLSAAINATTTLVPAAASGEAVASVATWSARVQALGPAHGIPLTAFPGTSGTARS